MTGCLSSHLYFLAMLLDSMLIPVTTAGLGVSVQSVRHNSFGRTTWFSDRVRVGDHILFSMGITFF